MFELGSGFQVKTLSISKRGLEYFDDYTNLRRDKTDQIIEGNVQFQGGYECAEKVINVLHTPDGNAVGPFSNIFLHMK